MQKLIETKSISNKLGQPAYFIEEENVNFDDNSYFLINGIYYSTKPNGREPSFVMLLDDVEDDDEKKDSSSIEYKKEELKTSTQTKLNNDKMRNKNHVFNDRPYIEKPQQRESRIYIPNNLKNKNMITPRKKESIESEQFRKMVNTNNFTSSNEFNKNKNNFFNFNPKIIKKRNHRREIDEPVLKDKPVSNKTVIYGGVVLNR